MKYVGGMRVKADINTYNSVVIPHSLTCVVVKF